MTKLNNLTSVQSEKFNPVEGANDILEEVIKSAITQLCKIAKFGDEHINTHIDHLKDTWKVDFVKLHKQLRGDSTNDLPPNTCVIIKANHSPIVKSDYRHKLYSIYNECFPKDKFSPDFNKVYENANKIVEAIFSDCTISDLLEKIKGCLGTDAAISDIAQELLKPQNANLAPLILLSQYMTQKISGYKQEVIALDNQLGDIYKSIEEVDKLADTLGKQLDELNETDNSLSRNSTDTGVEYGMSDVKQLKELNSKYKAECERIKSLDNFQEIQTACNQVQAQLDSSEYKKLLEDCKYIEQHWETFSIIEHTEDISKIDETENSEVVDQSEVNFDMDESSMNKNTSELLHAPKGKMSKPSEMSIIQEMDEPVQKTRAQISKFMPKTEKMGDLTSQREMLSALETMHNKEFNTLERFLDQIKSLNLKATNKLLIAQTQNKQQEAIIETITLKLSTNTDCQKDLEELRNKHNDSDYQACIKKCNTIEATVVSNNKQLCNITEEEFCDMWNKYDADQGFMGQNSGDEAGE